MGETLNIVADRIGSENAPGGASTWLQRIASRWRFIACLQALDFLILFMLALVWFRTLAPSTAGQSWLLPVTVSLFTATMIHCVFQCFRLYDFSVLKSGSGASMRAVAAGGISIAPFLAPLLVLPGVTGQAAETACAIAAAGLAGIAAMRLPVAVLARMLQQSGVVGRRIYLITDSGTAAASLRSMLERVPGNRVVGSWTMSGPAGPVESGLEGALTFLRHNATDVVILKMPLSQPDRLMEAARVLRGLPRTVMLAPSFDGADDRFLTTETPRADGLGNIVLVKLSERPLFGWRWVIKDIQDRSLALLLLVVVAPALIAIAIAIRLSSPGPVFFRQKRYGYAGETFEIFKFRTMRVEDSPRDARSLQLTTRGDPRVFPVGRILRKTSLDELPQLLNVLRGDMWIVGPRPHSPFAKAGGKIYAKAVREYAARYRIKPGITGWAQVSGWRGPTDTLEQLTNRVEHDIYYIENWSMSFDARILFRTLFCAFGDKNAF